MNSVRSSDCYCQQLKKQPHHVFSFSFLVGMMWKNAVIIQTIIYYVSVNVQFSMNSLVWNTKSPKITQKITFFFSPLGKFLDAFTIFCLLVRDLLI